ncbi:MAG: DNA polymerase III subunit delta [Oscillospiraceae bacterium]|nr:DNA polymerase III subunit delta [Oscillospiraceae bacterium]
MLFKDEQQFAEHLRGKELLNMYFLFGEESYLKQQYLAKLVSMAVSKDLAMFNLHKFDGKVSMDELSDVVYSFPVMAERRCVVVTDLDVEKLSASETEKLMELASTAPESCVLIFVTDLIEVNLKKSTKYKKLVEKMGKKGGAIELAKRDGAKLAQFMRQEAAKLKCTISADNCRYLIERCTDNMEVLKGEIRKLSEFCLQNGRDEITREDITECCAQTPDSSIYDITKAISRGNYNDAIKCLDELLYNRVEPVVIMATLSGFYIDLYRAKVANLSGKNVSDIVKTFSYGNRAFVVDKAFRESASYSEQSLADSIEVLRKGDEMLKGSRVEDSIILQQTLTRLFACRKRG